MDDSIREATWARLRKEVDSRRDPNTLALASIAFELRALRQEIEGEDDQEGDGRTTGLTGATYTNAERTIAVLVAPDGTAELLQRDDPSHTWPIGITLVKEQSQ